MTAKCSTGAYPLAWKETTPGTFTRPLDSVEAVFKWMADSSVPLKREHWAVSFAVRLALPDSLPASEAEPYIRRAWLILSKQHTMLYARPEGHSVTVSPLDEDEWLKKSFVTHTGEQATLDSVFTSIEPAPIASCHWLPDRRELLLHGSHWRLDGIGCLKLTDRLLAALGAVIRVGLDCPLESYGLDLTPLLTPSQEEVCEAYPDEDSTPRAVKKAADDLLQSFIKGMPSIGIPLTPGTDKALPGPSSRLRMTLDKATTAAVVAACKSRGYKVTSAVHAAVVQAAAAHPQHPQARHYCIYTAIDMRRRLPGGNKGDGPELAAGEFVAVGVGLIEDPAGPGGAVRPLDDIAREFDATYGADMSRLYDGGGGEMVSAAQVAAPFARRLAPVLQAAPEQAEDGPPQNAPILTSIGVMENWLKREHVVDAGEGTGISVEDVWMGGEMLAPGMCIHVWTWRDQMTLSVVYNTAYYEGVFVTQVMEDVKRNLLSGLRV